ncbi:MAG: T9SS type A sorting domain-containing protein, partial [Candidatus Kapaibacterium sp.]
DPRTTVLAGFWYSVVKDPRTSSATGGSTSTPPGTVTAGPVAITPHPVTNISTFKYTPDCVGVVTIELVDLAGETVAKIFNEYVAGDVNLSFDSNGLVSGTYLVRVKTSCSERSQRIVILH